MTSYEPSPYGPSSRPSGKNDNGANSGASSHSNPYKKPSSLSDNANADTPGKKPQSDFVKDMSNAFTEAKESITSAFNEIRSETTGKTNSTHNQEFAYQQYEGKQHDDDSQTSFDDVKKQFKEMWASRPVRLPADQGGGGKIAGVAEGIAVRYQIDPVLVRTVFVVTAFCWGGSIALYLLAWMIMPRYSKATSPIEDAFGSNKDLPRDSKGKSTSEKSLGTTLAVIFAIGFIIPLIFSSSSITMLLPIIAGIGGWYLLHKRRPDAPAGLLATPQQRTEPPRDEHIDLSMFEPVDGYPFPDGRTTPPAWDPLGAAPDTWHLPDPEPVQEPQPKKKRRWGRVLGITAAVIAVWSLIIGGILLAFGFAANSPSWTSSDWGASSYTPANEETLTDVYDVGIGAFSLDLSQTEGLDDMTEDRTVTIDGGIGAINLDLPQDTPVNVTCDSGIGQSNCVDLHHDDAKLTIDIDAGIGSTTIDYGYMSEEADKALTNIGS
ncbi:MAG: PspC domain-containing protein [Corynebacterium casei]|nr:PspC domain-containing protein [Corynebacterium casei]